MNRNDARHIDHRMSLLVDAVTDYALYMLEPDGRVATWNAGAQRLKGYEAEEIVGQHFSRFFTDEDRANQLPERALRIAAREGRFEAEGWRVRKDGSLFYANSVIDPIRSDCGELLGFAKISRDITERRDAERAARQSEQRFQLLVNSVTDYAIYMLDAHGSITTWNAGAQRFKGYTPDEIIGEHFSRFFTPQDRKAGKPGAILRTAQSEGRFEGEGWRVRKDGTLFLAHVIVDAIRDEDGQLLGYAKVTRDVTEIRERQRALFESEQRYRLLVQGVRDCAIYMLDPEGNVTNWNLGAQTIKGFEASEIIGKHFSIFYTEEDRANGLPAHVLETALRDGKYEAEAWRVKKDGSLFWASILIDPIHDEEGRHIGFAKLTRDMSERKKVEEELEEARDVVLQSRKMQAIGELTGGVAHDFNNLLTVISGGIEMMLRVPDMAAEKRQKYLESMQETVKRATTLTSHLLAFSRQRSISPEVLDLNVQLDAFAEILGRSLGGGVKVELNTGAIDACVEVDPTELETAILNAAVNARDAMPEGGTLRLETRVASIGNKAAVEIAIIDNGEGMSKELMDRVFEPFFTTKPIGKGTGLGLSQIHGFAAQAGGTAKIKSEVGKGTTISLILPCADSKPVAKQEKEEVRQLPHGLKVLLVEDNLPVRHFAEQLLKDLGADVASASDAAEALGLLEHSSFDVVFSDVVMPGMSGLDMAKQLRITRPELPVLLATGYSGRLKGDAAAGFFVLPKPYGALSLSGGLADLLGIGARKSA